jgi:drug/metabolite transporter (DMT)-like permease
MSDAHPTRRAAMVMIVLVVVWGYAWGSLAIPVVAIAGSAVQLGERPAASELTGMVLIGAALAIISWDTIRKHREVEPLTGQE